MPFINTKYSQKITPEQETELKTALGSAVSILGKTESWLMLGFEHSCSKPSMSQLSVFPSMETAEPRAVLSSVSCSGVIF